MKHPKYLISHCGLSNGEEQNAIWVHNENEDESNF